jgi:hypothetical protein
MTEYERTYLLRMLPALFAGYPMYVLLTLSTSSFTLVPDTKREVILVAGLTLSALVAKAMDIGSEDPAMRGDPSALKDGRDWERDRPRADNPTPIDD